MRQKRQGEQVRVEVQGIDANDEIESVLVWETYGYTNEEQNNFQNALVGKLLEFSKELGAGKAQYIKEHDGVDAYTARKVG